MPIYKKATCSIATSSDKATKAFLNTHIFWYVDHYSWPH